MWFGLDINGVYLPDITSPAITSKYLWKVLNKNCFYLEKKHTKQGTLLKQASKLALLDELTLILGREDLGFDE